MKISMMTVPHFGFERIVADLFTNVLKSNRNDDDRAVSVDGERRQITPLTHGCCQYTYLACVVGAINIDFSLVFYTS